MGGEPPTICSFFSRDKKKCFMQTDRYFHTVNKYIEVGLGIKKSANKSYLCNVIYKHVVLKKIHSFIFTKWVYWLHFCTIFEKSSSALKMLGIFFMSNKKGNQFFFCQIQLPFPDQVHKSKFWDYNFHYQFFNRSMYFRP